MKYVLNWNDEYLDMRIVCGPLSEENARQEMKKQVMKRLVELGIKKDARSAEKLYVAAERATVGKIEYELSISFYGATIRYNDYEDRYQIVDYDPER